MLAMARIDEKVGPSKSRQEHPPIKMKLPSRVERKCGEWCEVKSKTKDKKYYLNIRTKETTWKKPPDWNDQIADSIGASRKTLKDSPSLSTDSSSQDVPFAQRAQSTPVLSARHSRSSPPSKKRKHNKHRKSKSSRKSESPQRINSSLNSSNISTSSSSSKTIPSPPVTVKTPIKKSESSDQSKLDELIHPLKSSLKNLPAPIPSSVLHDPLSVKPSPEEQEKQKQRDQEIERTYSSKRLKIQQLERRHRLVKQLPENSAPDNETVLRQSQKFVSESIPSRIQELVYNKKEKQADFYSRENTRNEQIMSEKCGEIARVRHTLRNRTFFIESIDGFCSLQKKRSEALMLSSFSFSSLSSPAQSKDTVS